MNSPIYITEIKQIIISARNKAHTAINSAMVEAYWLIGKRIVEEEQNGKQRAEYGKEVIKTLSEELQSEFGQGFAERCLREYRQFYLNFMDFEFGAHCAPNLTWSHYRLIMRLTDKNAVKYYLTEASENNWSVRTLDRNISTLYYQRLLSSQNKDIIVAEMKEKTADFQDKLEFIKNPAVLEFLGLPNNSGYIEAELEKAIIDHIQQFLLELGKGFAFVSRQQLIKTETAEFYIDLVFYNFILKCFVLIELKTNKITHQDIGQLDMYVRMFDDMKKREGDNPTIGILLCTETDKTIARYSVLNENKQLFAAKYMPYLPTEDELITEIERQKEILKIQFNNDKDTSGNL
ncbi:MAG: PDDEXK nuclease domain-containing protein [Treponema sp.]|jgi:predicted nuclease of restriction endonuclease-like (RecB) superfamily|nr:PDDEXK nuclease domain-containing protein [Treponema sp.]